MEHLHQDLIKNCTIALMTGYPPKKLAASKNSVTIYKEGLHPNSVLIVDIIGKCDLDKLINEDSLKKYENKSDLANFI